MVCSHGLEEVWQEVTPMGLASERIALADRPYDVNLAFPALQSIDIETKIDQWLLDLGTF